MGARRSRRRDEGFTLIEVIIVTAIVALLLAVAIAAYGASTSAAQAAACRQNQETLTRAATLAAASGDAPEELADLEPYVTAFAKTSVCPKDETPLVLDPETGSVTCPNHP